MTLRIQCWSGPRNVSTALMYSFAQRRDTTVVDEPLYTHFLAVSGREDPDRDRIMASRSTDQRILVDQLILGPCPTPVLYLKQIGSHLLGVDRWFLARTENILLTRDPHDMLTSLAAVLPDATITDTGVREQVELLDDILAAGGTPIVIDSASLLRDPRGVLTEVCGRLGLEFDDAMLSWPAGPRPEDGVWAPHWYANVHRSTGFAPYRPKDDPLPPAMEPILEEARPIYERLRQYAIET